MKKLFYLNIIVLVAGFCSTALSQTSYSDDFSSELNEDVWITQEGHSYSIINEELNISVSKQDQSSNFRISFLDESIDISSNPVISFKARADKSLILEFYIYGGVSVIKELYIPKSDNMVSYSLNLGDAPSSFDPTSLKYIDIYVNKDAVSYTGTIIMDDFIVGEGAVQHANIGGISNQRFLPGQKSVKLLFKDIENAESISFYNEESFFENVEVSPVLHSDFSDFAYIKFDVKEDAVGEGIMEVTAKGARGFEDNTLEIGVYVVENTAPEINAADNQELEVGTKKTIVLEGIGDGDPNLEQELDITVSSSNQMVISNNDLKLSYENGSPYAKLEMLSSIAGSSDITIQVDDGGSGNSQSQVSFKVFSYGSLNHDPEIDEVDDQTPYYDGSESVLELTGISDGNENTQLLDFEFVSSVDTIVESSSIYITDFNSAEGTALLHYTPVGEGQTQFSLTITDDAAGCDNGVKSVVEDFLVKPVTLYPFGLDWEVCKDIDRWSGDAGITISSETFDGSEVLRVDCADKWIWGAVNFIFRDTSVNLTEHPYVSMEIYSLDNPTLHWLWFYDDYELTHDEAHRNDFPSVTSDEGKAVWCEAGEWTTVSFDFSGENEMSRNVDDSPVPINSKRITRILYNYHDQESTWPRPPEYTGTFYIRNMRIGDKAVMPDPLVTIDPVPDQINFAGAGSQTITITGLSDGKGGLPEVSVQSLNTGFVDPVISAVSSDGTADISYDPGISVGEALVVISVSAENSVSLTDTFLVKSLEKNVENAYGIEVNLTDQYQTFRGLGTYMNQYFDLYTQEMGATAMRVGIISNRIEEVNDNSDPFVLNREALDYTAFDWEAMKKMKEMGVESFILTSWSAPGWMKDNHSVSWYEGDVVAWEEATNRVSPFYYEEWAEFFVAAYRMFEEEAGIQLAGIGIQNEPAFYEPYPSAVLSPVEFAKIIAVVGRRFEEEGIEDCKLYMPEQVFSQNNYSMAEYITALQENPDADKYCDVIATHGYASDGIGSGTPDFSKWTTMYEQAQQGAEPKEMWMTETHRSYSSYDDAMWMAMAIYGAMEYGNVGLWTQWGIVGQHIIDGNPTQMLYTCANYSRFIKPGAVRVKSVSSYADLYSTVWVDDEDGRLTAVLINDSDTPVSAYLSGENIPSEYEIYLTTSIRTCEYMGESTDGLCVVPPNSVISLVATGNKAPLIDQTNDLFLEMDAPEQTIVLSGIDPVEEGQQIISIVAESDNSDLVPNPSVGTLQSDGTAVLTLQPSGTMGGMATISVSVLDDGSDFVSNQTIMEFDVYVNDVYNNPPVLSEIEDEYLLEDIEDTYSIAIAVTDGDDGSQSLSGSVESDNSELVKNLVYNNETGVVEFSVTPEYYGTANMKLTITDDGGRVNNNGNQSVSGYFTVYVAPVNDAPLFDPVEDMTVEMNSVEQSIILTGLSTGDSYGDAQSLAVSVVADDLSLITSPVVFYSGGSSAEIKFTPVRNQVGTLNLSIYVADDGGTANGGTDLTIETIQIEIIPDDINQAPYMNEIEDQVLYLDEGSRTISLEGVDDGNEDKDQTISVLAVSSDESVIAAPVVNWIPSMNMGSIKLTALSEGVSTITLSLQDNGGTEYGGEDTREYTFLATVYANVGIEEDALMGFNLYPNPAGDYVYLEIPVDLADSRLSLCDLSGKVMDIQTVEFASGTLQIDISGLERGMYILRFENDEKSFRTYLIKN